MLTADQIADAKRQIRYSTNDDVLHEHDDCVRFAYEWLDAQRKTASAMRRHRPLKHIIEMWAGRYVSQSDVEVAAFLHPEISGKYPYFNISLRLVEPSAERISTLEEFDRHKGREKMDPLTYSTREAERINTSTQTNV